MPSITPVPTELGIDNAPPVLSISSLSVHAVDPQANVPVLTDISFQVRAGEIVCIVGESGSGKSVTSLAVMGLLPRRELVASAGQILVNGEDTLSASANRLRQMRATQMAMVFQEPMTALNPVETVGFQIEEVLRLHTGLNRTERHRKVLDMLSSVHLPDVDRIYDAYPHELSGGQRQRIVIAMALILKPKLLIADEPTTALDVTTQKQILSLIRELQQKQNTAVLFITHDFGVVAEIADRIIVMYRGKVIEVGNRDDILARPVEPYTRKLVTSVPSLVPVKLEASKKKNILDVVSLSKVYTQKKMFGRDTSVAAASDVSLSLGRAEIAGIVGESGSGKSTVARCIVRLIQPTSGSVCIDGVDVSRQTGRQLSLWRRRVQVVFQDPYRSLNPRMRIGDSVIEGLTNFGMRRAEAMEKARDLLKVVGLDAEVLQRYPHQFSGGQRQRICIARALSLEPEVLVADEAVSALDVSVQAQVLQLLREIRERTGIAILFITHDLRVAAQICDTIVVMQKGRIVESGSAVEVLTNPREAYTRALISAAPGRNWDFQNLRPLDAASLQPIADPIELGREEIKIDIPS
ncbi:ABC transporter ATP-binding protein [Alcaligenaceae bacterium CGII-47]|nr:ABC transporter ATP-binding protein [Alcaligenaceae bacterium CGII-47]